MEKKSIVSIHLIRENMQKDIGVVRVEQIELEDENGNIETDNSAGFDFQYHEDDDTSYEVMINEIANRYGVSPEIINIEE